MSNLKLSLLSYNIVEYFLCFIVINISKYERAVVFSVVFLSWSPGGLDVIYGIIKIGFI